MSYHRPVMLNFSGQRPDGSESRPELRDRITRRIEREFDRARWRLISATRNLPGRTRVKYRGSIMPPPLMRADMCGPKYSRNDLFLESGCAEARRVVSKLGYRDGMQIVEIGSGVGRLAIGLLREVGEVAYHGFEPVPEWVEWCQRHVGAAHPSFRFTHIDVENENYNPAGSVAGGEFVFPVADAQADIVYMWGVFTNMRLADARNYVAEIARMTGEGGRVFLTAFVEEDVPDETINPTDYVLYPCTSPLHVVRYSRRALFSLFEENSLEVEEFAHHGGSNCNQSEITLRKAGSR